MFTYIRLSNFAPSKNKFRIYAITIEQPIVEHHHQYSVYLSWGRVAAQQKQQQYQFSTKKDMLNCIQNTLHRRQLHGYEIIEKSEYFPQVKALDNLPYGNRVGEQLSLFSML